MNAFRAVFFDGPHRRAALANPELALKPGFIVDEDDVWRAFFQESADMPVGGGVRSGAPRSTRKSAVEDCGGAGRWPAGGGGAPSADPREQLFLLVSRSATAWQTIAHHPRVCGRERIPPVFEVDVAASRLETVVEAMAT